MKSITVWNYDRGLRKGMRVLRDDGVWVVWYVRPPYAVLRPYSFVRDVVVPLAVLAATVTIVVLLLLEFL